MVENGTSQSINVGLCIFGAGLIVAAVSMYFLVGVPYKMNRPITIGLSIVSGLGMFATVAGFVFLHDGISAARASRLK